MSAAVAEFTVKLIAAILFCLLVVQFWGHYEDRTEGRTIVGMAMQVDSMKNQLDIAQWYVNRLQSRLDSAERACKRRGRSPRSVR